MDNIPIIYGVALFAIGLIVDDIYTVVTGLSLGIMSTVSATGEKVIQTLSTKPKETKNMTIETLHAEIRKEIEQSKATREMIGRRIVEMKEHYI